MELHTLGVDGGYTQKDVIRRRARAHRMDASTIRGRAADSFSAPGSTTPSRRSCSGTRSPAGAARKTARRCSTSSRGIRRRRSYIAIKLVRRFVSDTPPRALVDRAAETYRRTDGDIREVLRTIITSPGVLPPRGVSREGEDAVRARAEHAADHECVAGYVGEHRDQIQRMGEQLFGHLAPNGWPETGDQWINAGSLLDRINFGVQVGAGRLRFAPAEQWPGYALLSAMPLDKQVDGIVDQLLGGNASPETREILFKGQNPLVARAATDTSMVAAAPKQPSLKDLLGIALGSPEFQRR